MKNKKTELWDLCQQFIEKQRISCPEAVMEDRVILNAYDFIEKIANIVGYYKYENEDI